MYNRRMKAALVFVIFTFCVLQKFSEDLYCLFTFIDPIIEVSEDYYVWVWSGVLILI